MKSAVFAILSFNFQFIFLIVLNVLLRVEFITPARMFRRISCVGKVVFKLSGIDDLSSVN